MSLPLRPPLSRPRRAIRLAMAAAGFLGFLSVSSASRAAVVLPNTGNLGSAANATTSDTGVTFGPGAVTAGSDQTAIYDGITGKASIPFQAALNPAGSNPFSVEFWAKPTASDNDDATVGNRNATGNRTGWVFFQRAAGLGWNFRMYNGNGSALGWDVTGGTANLNEWNHVVATWDGANVNLYVNGQFASNTNGGAGGFNGNNGYNPNTAAGAPAFIIGQDDTGSPATGPIDEVAWYPTALSGAQVANHFAAISSTTPGFYQSMVRADGAALQISNNVPEPSSALLLGAGAAGSLLLRRRRQGER